MYLSDLPNICENFIPFTLETSPHDEDGSDGVHRLRRKAKTLRLFPLTPGFEPLKKESSNFYGQGQQRSEQDSGLGVVIRSESELEPRDHDGSAVLSSNYLTSRCVLEVTPCQTPFKKPRKALSMVSSQARSQAFVDSVCCQSSSTPSLDPLVTSPKERGQSLGPVGELVGLQCQSTFLYNGVSTSVTGIPNGSASASSSKASSKNVSLCTPSSNSSGHTKAGESGAEAIGTLSNQNRRPSARHGPRPRSSSFRGVTHYKRTGRWEAHIWNKGKQIYLGASSTAEKAARAYDRAAIHFRKMGADLNYCMKDYVGELRKLVELSERQLVTMLRKQSAGEGTLYPEYPPSTKLFGAPIYLTAREELNQEDHTGTFLVESIPQKKKQVDFNFVKDPVSCNSSVRSMAKSDLALGVSTLHVPEATHISKRRRHYLRIIDNMTEGL